MSRLNGTALLMFVKFCRPENHSKEVQKKSRSSDYPVPPPAPATFRTPSQPSTSTAASDGVEARQPRATATTTPATFRTANQPSTSTAASDSVEARQSHTAATTTPTSSQAPAAGNMRQGLFDMQVL